jgi:hypothetical protein
MVGSIIAGWLLRTTFMLVESRASLMAIRSLSGFAWQKLKSLTVEFGNQESGSKIFGCLPEPFNFLACHTRLSTLQLNQAQIHSVQP